MRKHIFTISSSLIRPCLLYTLQLSAELPTKAHKLHSEHKTQPCYIVFSFSLQSWPIRSMLSCETVVRPDGKNENGNGVHMGPPQTTLQHFRRWPDWELITSCNKTQHTNCHSKKLSVIYQFHVSVQCIPGLAAHSSSCGVQIKNSTATATHSTLKNSVSCIFRLKV